MTVIDSPMGLLLLGLLLILFLLSFSMFVSYAYTCICCFVLNKQIYIILTVGKYVPSFLTRRARSVMLSWKDTNWQGKYLVIARGRNCLGGGTCGGRGECLDLHAGLQVSTCSGYDLCQPGSHRQLYY